MDPVASAKPLILLARPTGNVGGDGKCPSNMNKYAVLRASLIPPSYTTYNGGDARYPHDRTRRCSVPSPRITQSG